MRYFAALLIACACLCVGGTPAQTTNEKEELSNSGLIEETRRRLIQLDVSVTGPPELTADLKPDDFKLVVGGKVIKNFHADRVCGGQPRPAKLTTPQELESAERKDPPIIGVRYLFYFDQNHLTFEGRRRSLEVARKLIPELIFEPNRAQVVSSGRTLEILADWTSDQQVLLDALDVVYEAPTQWDTWASQEDSRIQQIFELASLEMDQGGALTSTTRLMQSAMNQATGTGRNSGYQAASDTGQSGVSTTSSTKHLAPSAKNMARMFRKEEKWHTERALTRFSMVLAGMVEMSPPKAVVYFADRMRSNAGDHYMYLFREDKDAQADPSVSLSNSRVIAFDDVLNEAATNGVRLYTVQAEGIPAYLPMSMSSGEMRAFNITPEATTRRFDEAREGLAAFALESGGRAFLNGAQPEKIVEGLQTDLDCFYILSFDPEKLREDSALPVLLSSNVKGVKTSTRGRLMIQSESARLQSRLTAAFVNPSLDGGTGPPLSATVIPLSFHKGSYSALVQVAVPGSSRPNATWDIGLSLVSGTRVPFKESKRLAMTTPGVPLILELMLEFDPGPYELGVVAHEDGSDKISTGHVEGDWPDPASPNATIGPIALLQPGTGAFVHGDDVRRQGSLATGNMARTDLPAALVGIVCRPGTNALRVERMLVGASSAVFPSLELEDGGERCSIFSDTIPSGTMTSGKFRYEVRVLSRDEEIAGRDHEFMAAALADLEEQASDSR